MESDAKVSRDVQRLSQALRRRRRELGLTQKELSRFAGCGVDFLYDLENAKPTVRLDKVLAVLDVLGLSLHLEQGRTGIRVDAALDLPERE